MRGRFALCGLCVFFALNTLGCAPLIVGAAVGGGVAVATSKDTMQLETDKSFDSVWNAALVVAKIRGGIKQQDYDRGYLYLETDSGRVWIHLVRLTRATVRLKVAARKYHMPNIELAQDLTARIMEQAR